MQELIFHTSTAHSTMQGSSACAALPMPEWVADFRVCTWYVAESEMIGGKLPQTNVVLTNGPLLESSEPAPGHDMMLSDAGAEQACAHDVIQLGPGLELILPSLPSCQPDRIGK